jgi:hypothetical protein
MDTGGRKDDAGMDKKARAPGSFASQEEFDEARRNLATYIATLKGWRKDGAVWMALKDESARDFSRPSLS